MDVTLRVHEIRLASDDTIEVMFWIGCPELVSESSLAALQNKLDRPLCAPCRVLTLRLKPLARS